ncbi:DUF7668 domain-containing protein [Rubritalea tangerina]|uniref:DUF7668 domain-containing protein n=1 Tax=Rubritalea tangerina TaxID=430798 RepID=A0ABW4Z974_9BACT
MKDTFIPVTKDEDNEQPIPTIWRPLIHSIVDRLVDHDYGISGGLSGVLPVTKETSDQIKNYIDDYGEVLSRLPERTWDSSVCIWMETHWDILVDLWTEGEGRSDLVLGAKVFETNSQYSIEVDMVYVP